MVTGIITRLVIILTIASLPALAQENVFLHPDKFYKKYFPHMRVKRDPPDSLFIKRYPNYLSAGMYVVMPAVYINVISPQTREAIKFRTNIDDVIGFHVSYRYVSAGFAFLSQPIMMKRPGYGPTSYHTATINYNGTLFSFQFKYLKLLGMTDINTPAYPDPYTTRSDLSLKEYHFVGLYNISWRKYSYHAPLDFSERQVKSRGGFLVKTGVHYSEFWGSSDLVSAGKQSGFQNVDGMQGIRRFSIQAAPGMGGTYVIKRSYYVAAAVFFSNDLYFYRYLNTDGTTTKRSQRYVVGFDGYASAGFQSERFYAGIKYEVNGSRAMLRDVQLNSFFTYTGITLGYRFNTPKAIRKFYRKTMPPGM